MKVECTRGFGIVEHPETGEEINVEEPFETDEATFEALDEAYPGFEVVEDASDSDESGGKTGEDADVEICGTEMSDGSICQRPADSCGYHG